MYYVLRGSFDKITDVWFYVNSNDKGYHDIQNTMFDRDVPFDEFEIDYFERMFKEMCPGRPNPHDRLKLSDEPQIQLTYWWSMFVGPENWT